MKKNSIIKKEETLLYLDELKNLELIEIRGGRTSQLTDVNISTVCATTQVGCSVTYSANCVSGCACK